MAYLKIKSMQQDELTWWQSFISWLNINWFALGVMGLVAKFIDSLFKWLTKRSEARVKEIYQEQYESTVRPEINKLTSSIEGLKESVWALKDKIK